MTMSSAWMETRRRREGAKKEARFEGGEEGKNHRLWQRAGMGKG